MKTVIGYRGQVDAGWDWRVPEAPDAAPALPRGVAQLRERARRVVSALRPHFPATARPWLVVAGIALAAAMLVAAIPIIGPGDGGDSGQAVLSAAAPPAASGETGPASAGSLTPSSLAESAAGARILAGMSARGALVFTGFFLVILVLAAELWFVRHSEPRRRLSGAQED